jgi:hypothetical protein
MMVATKVAETLATTVAQAVAASLDRKDAARVAVKVTAMTGVRFSEKDASAHKAGPTHHFGRTAPARIDPTGNAPTPIGQTNPVMESAT